jgi:hypothetical protein
MLNLKQALFLRYEPSAQAVPEQRYDDGYGWRGTSRAQPAQQVQHNIKYSQERRWRR